MDNVFLIVFAGASIYGFLKITQEFFIEAVSDFRHSDSNNEAQRKDARNGLITGIFIWLVLTIALLWFNFQLLSGNLSVSEFLSDN